MQVRLGDKWMALYRFDLQEQFLPDYEIGNWYTSTHPKSRFVTQLVAARVDHGCRHTLRNNVLSAYHLNGATERRTLGSTSDLRVVLQTVFRLVLPDAQELDAVLERAISQPS